MNLILDNINAIFEIEKKMIRNYIIEFYSSDDDLVNIDRIKNIIRNQDIINLIQDPQLELQKLINILSMIDLTIRNKKVNKKKIDWMYEIDIQKDFETYNIDIVEKYFKKIIKLLYQEFAVNQQNFDLNYVNKYINFIKNIVDTNDIIYDDNKKISFRELFNIDDKNFAILISILNIDTGYKFIKVKIISAFHDYIIDNKIPDIKEISKYYTFSINKNGSIKCIENGKINNKNQFIFENITACYEKIKYSSSNFEDENIRNVLQDFFLDYSSPKLVNDDGDEIPASIQDYADHFSQELNNLDDENINKTELELAKNIITFYKNNYKYIIINKEKKEFKVALPYGKISGYNTIDELNKELEQSTQKYKFSIYFDENGVQKCGDKREPKPMQKTFNSFEECKQKLNDPDSFYFENDDIKKLIKLFWENKNKPKLGSKYVTIDVYSDQFIKTLSNMPPSEELEIAKKIINNYKQNAKYLVIETKDGKKLCVIGFPQKDKKYFDSFEDCKKFIESGK